jgi:hypothetical protein
MAKKAETKPAAPAATETKFGAFISAKKLDGRRLIIASTELEKLRPEDRAIRLAHRTRKEGEKKPEGADKKKPRSGRPVTPRALSAALTGKTVAGPMKTRILRAVNRVLEQKKQEPVTLDVLF